MFGGFKINMCLEDSEEEKAKPEVETGLLQSENTLISDMASPVNFNRKLAGGFVKNK
jgi:hypothetical protein